MAEFVERRCEDMISQLEQMERLKLFDKNEIRSIAKKLEEYEYKLQRHTKCKEDYLRYIQYEMDLLKLIKQRRSKYSITQKIDIDSTIVNKINNLYKDAIFRFQDDIRFWIAYMKFCKHMHFHNNIEHILSRMLQVYRDKPKCWHIAAHWELEENNNRQNAQQFLLRGLDIHPESQLLYIDAFKLELEDNANESVTAKNTENQEESSLSAANNNEMLLPLKRAYVIYQQAFERVKDIKFIIELLNIAERCNNTEKLQKKIIFDMIQEYAHEPLMWDKMARRELQGLVRPDTTDMPMELNNSEQTSLRARIALCNEVYETAVKKLNNKEMWSLYIDCLLEINNDEQSLPNFKRKLLKTALTRAHQARKLKEKHYLHWFGTWNDDEKSAKKLNEILSEATDAIPNSVSLWHERTRFLLRSGQEKKAIIALSKATKILGEKALPLWRMRILHVQIKNSEKTEKTFQDALQAHPLIARDIKSMYIEWLVLTKNISAARKVYEEVCVQLPTSLELHKQMAALELMQPEVSVEHMRRPYEMVTREHGSKNTSIWMDYVTFEMKHGDPKRVSDIHARALKSLDRNLMQSFIKDYSLLLANFDSKKELIIHR